MSRHQTIRAPDGCARCKAGGHDAFRGDFTMAFQPIVDMGSGRIFGHEALVRGIDGSGAGAVLSKLRNETLYSFDQLCRVKAITLGSRLGIGSILSINFMPNAIYEPTRCLQTTLKAARRAGFPSDRIMFELTESEAVRDLGHLRRIFETYRSAGFTLAIDDFGAGYAGMGLLADLDPDIVKLDMHLIRGIDRDARRRHILDAMVTLSGRLGFRLVAEGIETPEELDVVTGAGITLCQGYLLGRPKFEGLVSEEEIRAA